MKYNRYGRKAKTNRNALVFGMIFTVAAFFIIVLLASILLSALKNPLGVSGIASFAVLLLTGSVSGFVTAKYKGEHGVLPSVCCAIIFALVLFGSGLIASGGKIASIIVINLICYVVFAFIFSALACKKKRRRSR